MGSREQTAFFYSSLWEFLSLNHTLAGKYSGQEKCWALLAHYLVFPEGSCSSVSLQIFFGVPRDISVSLDGLSPDPKAPGQKSWDCSSVAAFLLK